MEKENKFKIGDKVKHSDHGSGTVLKLYSHFGAHIKFDTEGTPKYGSPEGYLTHNNEIVLLGEETKTESSMKQVTKEKCKVGDKVRCHPNYPDGANYRDPIAGVGEVIEIESESYHGELPVHVKWDSRDAWHNVGERGKHDLVFAEEASKEEPVDDSSSKFKVGDHIIGLPSIGSKYTITKEGWKGKVLKVYSDTKIRAKSLEGAGEAFDLQAEYFTLVKTAEEVSEEKDREIGIGDWITFKSIIKPEKVVAIDGHGQLSVAGTSSREQQKLHPSSYRLCTPEEIAAHQDEEQAKEKEWPDLKKGDRVKRGPDWHYNDQDTRDGGTGIGTVVRISTSTVRIEWDVSGYTDAYAYSEGSHTVQLSEKAEEKKEECVFVPNNWYVNCSTSEQKDRLGLLYYDGTKGGYFGFWGTGEGSWGGNWGMVGIDRCRLATEDEVKDVLVAEAVRLGFVPGVRFESASDSGEFTLKAGWRYDIHMNKPRLLGGQAGCVFIKGKWAEPVEIPKSDPEPEPKTQEAMSNFNVDDKVKIINTCSLPVGTTGQILITHSEDCRVEATDGPNMGQNWWIPYSCIELCTNTDPKSDSETPTEKVELQVGDFAIVTGTDEWPDGTVVEVTETTIDSALPYYVKDKKGQEVWMYEREVEFHSSDGKSREIPKDGDGEPVYEFGISNKKELKTNDLDLSTHEVKEHVI